MNAQALIQDGINLLQRGELAGAKAAFERVLEQAPDNADALYWMGVLALQTGHLEHGAQYMIRAVNAGGHQADLFGNLASALNALKRHEEALLVLGHGAQRHPGNSRILTMLGAQLRDCGRTGDARNTLEHALKIAPDDADAHLEMARLARIMGNAERADLAFRRSVDLAPSLTAHNEYALFLSQSGRDEEAVTQFQAALALNPDAQSILSNLGFAFYALGRADDSLAIFDRALGLEPDNAEIHALRAFPLLLKGHLLEGWHEYEWRLKSATFPAPPIALDSPLWERQPLKGKTLLLVAEQGYGDTLQFVRYAKPLADRGARVLVAVQEPLVELLKSVPGVAETASFNALSLPAHDYHIHMMSMPHRLGDTLETIPADVPYITADPALAARWRKRLEGYKGLRVGIVWSGNPLQRNNLKRSCPTSAITPLTQIAGVQMFSLAKDRNANAGPLPSGMIDLGGEIKTFADTAAIMSNLDLVISVCTSTAHLAGAMGRPTWLMLAQAADWRWLKKRSDSPWYPTARLFRQRRLYDWNGPIVEIAEALRLQAQKR